jgi:hypothetical protein
LAIISWFLLVTAKLPMHTNASRRHGSSTLSHSFNKLLISAAPKTPTWFSGLAVNDAYVLDTSRWMSKLSTVLRWTSRGSTPSFTNDTWFSAFSVVMANIAEH